MELRLAKWLMNREVREALESRPVFDPASLDALSADAPPEYFMTVDEALRIDPDGERATGRDGHPWMPFEVIL